MPYRHRKRWTRRERSIVAVPLVISLVLWLLPQTWTGRMINAVQYLNPFHEAVNNSLSVVDGAMASPPKTILPAEAEAVQRQNEALKHQITALAARVNSLEDEVGHLTDARQFTVDGKNLGPRGQLIPATVVGDDFLSWRSSLLLTAGTSQGVQKGNPVASRYFTIASGADEGVSVGQSILLGEVLIGWIDQAGSQASRVKLCSDITSQMKVRIGRWADDGVHLIDGYYWLTGKGKGVMEIKGVERRLTEGESTVIRVGDVVLSDPMSTALPAGLTVGYVDSLAPDLHSPLLAILSVSAPLNERSLDRVYVFDPAAN